MTGPGHFVGSRFGTALPPTGVTPDEPPPASTPLSAWPPMTATDFTFASGSRLPSFFSSTSDSSAARCATAAFAAKSILPTFGGSSNTPVWNSGHRMRCAMSSRRRIDTSPLFIASLKFFAE